MQLGGPIAPHRKNCKFCNSFEKRYKTTLLAMKGLSIELLAGFSLYPVKVKGFSKSEKGLA
jgi:hypothetical protein